MLLRIERNDIEGFYRWHWLLVDSLEIYCDICSLKYFGPKKALIDMQADNPAAYEKYGKALKTFNQTFTVEWIHYLKTLRVVL